MSENKQPQVNPNNVRRSLIIILAVALIGVGWYFFQNRGGNGQPAENAQQETQQASENNDEQNELEDWPSYTWASQDVSFKYPAGWVTEENTTMGRLYVKNSQVDLLTQETPDDFQQIWLSHDTDEVTQSREEAIKKDQSDWRAVNGEVKASTIKAGDLTINIYEYETLGGPTLEAYFTNSEGTRLYATNSTDVGAQNQTEMVANLKKLLASLTFAE